MRLAVFRNINGHAVIGNILLRSGIIASEIGEAFLTVKVEGFRSIIRSGSDNLVSCTDEKTRKLKLYCALYPPD